MKWLIAIKDSINLHALQLKPMDDAVISELPIPATYLVIDNGNKADFENLIKPILQYQKAIYTAMPDKNIITSGFSLNIYFDGHLSFQDYISMKSTLEKLNTEKLKITSNEFIY